MPSCKLTKRTIDALPAPTAADQIWWDEDLKGCGLKLTPAGRKVFLVQYRPAGDRRNPSKYTIGEYGPVTPHQARVEAQRVLAERAAGRADVPRTGHLVFSGDGERPFQGYSKGKARLDRVSGVADWTLHDLRRTVVSGMARLGVAPHVADKILNHQTGTISGVAAVYQRHEFLKERLQALEVWGEHVSGLVRQLVAPA